jgi:hypothetical protein
MIDSRAARVGAFVQTTIRWLMVCAAIFSASTACAQIYKWVDENGVTNYSHQRPTDAKAPRQVEVVENNISVYTPDPSLVRAVDAFRMRSNELGLNAAAPAVSHPNQYVMPVYVPVPVPSDPCAGYRSAHCGEFYTGYYPYAPVVGHRRFRHRNTAIPQIRLEPGAIAGQVVGTGGYIPGNSANARRFGPAPSRSLSRPAFEPSFTGGGPAPSRFR